MRAVLAFALGLLVAAPAAARGRGGDAPAEILFTFDDGPSLERTPKVLDTLDRYGVKAVFFVNGWHFRGDKPEAERAREILRETARRGHLIGNHTVHHYFLCGKLGRRLAREEIVDNAALIERATGTPPLLFRTPYGSRCPQLKRTLDDLGIQHTHWDIDPQDWKVLNTKKVRDYIVARLRGLRGRAILLFHDVHEDTVRALPQVLEWIVRENAAREARGEAPIRILDYEYLLPPRPAVPPIVDEIGRALIDQLPLEELGRGLRWFGLRRTFRWSS